MHYSIIGFLVSVIAGVIVAYALDQVTGEKTSIISGVCILLLIVFFICVSLVEKAHGMNQVSPHVE